MSEERNDNQVTDEEMERAIGENPDDPSSDLLSYLKNRKVSEMHCGIILWIILFLINAQAFANTIILPDETVEIEEEAFMGCTEIDRIEIPGTVQVIAPNAFQNNGEALLLLCEPDSCAARFAVENRLDYQAGTVYRALLIGQTYDGTERQLYGPRNDLDAMRHCLERLTSTPFQVTALGNCSVNEIKNAVTSVFSQATEYDVSLFYYSGHGNADGSLVGAGDNFLSLSPAELKAVLDQIPGRKVIIVDACASGILIGDETEDALSSALPSDLSESAMPDGNRNLCASSFVNGFLSPFSRKSRGGFQTASYFVLTSAHGAEDSQEGRIRENGITVTMGFFTFAFCRGCGWNEVKKARRALEADQNFDGAVSIQEAYLYAKTLAASYNQEQSADVWPDDCRWFAPFRRQE